MVFAEIALGLRKCSVPVGTPAHVPWAGQQGQWGTEEQLHWGDSTRASAEHSARGLKLSPTAATSDRAARCSWPFADILGCFLLTFQKLQKEDT